MKKIILMVSLVALTLTVGCSKDQAADAPTPKVGTLRASAEADTRTSLNESLQVVWSAGNEIAALTAENSTVVEKYTLSSEPGSKFGDFTGPALSGGGEIYALYPYSEAVNYSNGKLNFTIPATQTYAKGSFANNAMPMVGKGATTTNNISFKNLMGAVVFKVAGNQTVASLRVTTVGEIIAGAAGVAVDYPDAPELIMSDAGATSITLTDVNVELSAIATAFYVALPAGTYAAGLKFELLDDAGDVLWTTTTNKEMTVNRSRLAPLKPVTSEVFFPDAAFRNYLVSQDLVLTSDKTDIDVNHSTNIEKFASLTAINCSNKGVTSLKGTQPNLARL